jgi:hypothetical protein
MARAALPDMRDPKLWMLGCKEGEETAILVALLNKYVAREAAGERLGLVSAVCTAKGCVVGNCGGLAWSSWRAVSGQACLLGLCCGGV